MERLINFFILLIILMLLVSSCSTVLESNTGVLPSDAGTSVSDVKETNQSELDSAVAEETETESNLNTENPENTTVPKPSSVKPESSRLGQRFPCIIRRNRIYFISTVYAGFQVIHHVPIVKTGLVKNIPAQAGIKKHVPGINSLVAKIVN